MVRLWHPFVNSLNFKYFYLEVTLHVLETMGVHIPDKPVITPLPSQELIHTAMERECARRAFWLIHFYEMRRSIFWKLPITWKENKLVLRLPTNETSFEFTAHSSLPGVDIAPLCLARSLTFF